MKRFDRSQSILIVDDETEVLQILTELLEKRGYQVTATNRGDTALTLVGQNHYSVILADLKMPGFDGFKLAQSLRRLRPEAKIIVMSGYGQQVSQDLDNLGIQSYVVKPVDFDHLLQTVNEIIA